VPIDREIVASAIGGWFVHVKDQVTGSGICGGCDSNRCICSTEQSNFLENIAIPSTLSFVSIKSWEYSQDIFPTERSQTNEMSCMNESSSSTSGSLTIRAKSQLSFLREVVERVLRAVVNDPRVGFGHSQYEALMLSKMQRFLPPVSKLDMLFTLEVDNN
jgi:hypothetical protein